MSPKRIIFRRPARKPCLHLMFDPADCMCSDFYARRELTFQLQFVNLCLSQPRAFNDLRKAQHAQRAAMSGAQILSRSIGGQIATVFVRIAVLHLGLTALCRSLSIVYTLAAQEALTVVRRGNRILILCLQTLCC
jgi:hypothetical protein